MPAHLLAVHSMLTSILDSDHTSFRQLFVLSPDPTWIIEFNQFVECNEAAVRTLGYASRDELLNLHPSRLSPAMQPDGEDSFAKAERMMALARENGLHRFEWVHLRADGSAFTAEVTLSAFGLHGRQLIYCVWRDISARKQVEKALSDSHEAFRQILAATQDGYWRVDGELNLLDVNPAYCRLSGHTREELLGMKISDLDALQDAAFIAQKCRHITEIGHDQFETLHRRKDGSIWHVEISVTSHDAGRGQFHVFLRDISERKLAESRLKDSEARYKHIIENAPIGIFRRALVGPYVYVNPGVVRQFECATEAEFRSRYSQTTQRWASHERLAEFNARLLREGKVLDFEVETRLVNGATKWFLLFAFLDESGAYLNGFSLDITERKQAEEKLNRYKQHLEEEVQQRTHDLVLAREAAEAANAAKDTFLANISHELRTPLNAVIGMAELAQAISSEAKQRDYLNKIVTSGKHLNHIINDLLDLSKIAAGYLEFEQVAFSLPRLIANSNALLLPRASGKGLQLIESFDPAVPEVLIGDPLRIEQIVLNLTGNAVKFTASGRVEVRVGVHERQTERVCLDIEVQDTGVGIGPAALERMFKPFSQADATVSRKFGGTGLGLAISKRLAEMMDGDLTVCSQEGSGTTFRLRIWLGIGKTGELPVAPALAQRALPSGYQGVRVLVVDDQLLNREIVEALLNALGISSQMAENGRQALDMLDEVGPAAFDLVLMDIQMPLMDGLTATRLLRSRPGFDTLPIVAMSAHTMEHEKKNCLDAGMIDHIGKPFDNASFYRMLARWLPTEKHVGQAVVASPAVPPAPVDARGALNQLQGIDVPRALARFNGKEGRYRHWLADFVATAGEVPERIRNEVSAGRIDSAAMTLHTFKARWGTLGMEEIHAAAEAIEQSLRQRQDCDAQLVRLDGLIAAMREQLLRVLGV